MGCIYIILILIDFYIFFLRHQTFHSTHNDSNDTDIHVSLVSYSPPMPLQDPSVFRMKYIELMRC
jgi:hypothetical protein